MAKKQKLTKLSDEQSEAGNTNLNVTKILGFSLGVGKGFFPSSV